MRVAEQLKCRKEAASRLPILEHLRVADPLLLSVRPWVRSPEEWDLRVLPVLQELGVAA